MFATGIEPGCDRSDPASPADNLQHLRDGLQRAVEALDPAALTPEAAVGLTETFAEIERLAAAGKVLTAHRAREANVPALRGHRSPARWLALLSGAGTGEAQELLSAAEQLGRLPATEAALRTGRLSSAQLRAVADGATADPDAGQALLGVAEGESLFALRQAAECAKAAARSAQDDAARHARAHARRALRCSTHGDGTFSIEGHGTTIDGLTITRALRQEHERLFRAAAQRGERPTYAALSWDALVAISQKALGEGTADAAPATAKHVGGAAVKLIVNVTYDALCRGYTVTGETCEIAGLGPLPVTAVRELLAHPNTFLAAVLTKGQQVLGVAHLGRGPNAHQRTALEWLNPTCAVEGCDNTILEYDHDIDYSMCHQTELTNLNGKCGPHHHLKTTDGWRLQPGTGKRRYLPPDHPDHPGNPRRRPGPKRTRASPPTSGPAP